MIEPETVFILGAGASAPYGYPTGAELITAICDHFPGRIESLYRDKDDSAHFERIGHTNGKTLKMIISEFTTALRQATPPSIDVFLSHRPEFKEVGKQAVLIMIAACESPERVVGLPTGDKAPGHGDNWYRYLYHRILENAQAPDDVSKNNPPTFLTFNYDRSLEYFLYTSLMNEFGDTHCHDIAQILEQIRIYHIYGRIDDPPWKAPSLQFGDPVTLDTTQKLYENIRTIREVRHKDKSDAKEAIQAARRVFFLGFGYAKENLINIGYPYAFATRPAIYGTALGFEPREIADCVKYFQNQGKHSPGSEIKLESAQCLTLLKKYL